MAAVHHITYRAECTKISGCWIFVEQSVRINRKGVKQFVVIIDANQFSNHNSYAIRHIKILFQPEQ
jgi:hypothetical protein